VAAVLIRDKRKKNTCAAGNKIIYKKKFIKVERVERVERVKRLERILKSVQKKIHLCGKIICSRK